MKKDLDCDIIIEDESKSKGDTKMAKTITIFCILTILFSIPVYGQNMGIEEALLSQSGISGIGITRLNGETFYRMQLQPNINLGKIGFGLDCVLLYNPTDDEIRTEDGEKWDSDDYLRAIRYIRYGHKSPTEPVYALYGALDYATIGHGSIMEGYSNYDRRGLRLNLNVSEGLFGVESLLNNFADPTIFGGRLHVRPLQRMEIPVIGRLTLGATYMTDIDPEPNNEEVESLVARGVDVGIPIIDHRLLQMQLYDDLVWLSYENGTSEENDVTTRKGNVTGIGTAFMGGIHFKIEYRQFEEGFRPTIFNYTYEHDKTQEDGLQFNKDPLKGIYSQLSYSLMNKLFLAGAYENYDNSDPNLHVQLTESGLVEKVSFSALYTKDQIGKDKGEGFFNDIFDLDERSLLTLRIGYEIFKPLEVAIIREYRFRETDDGKGFETVNKTSFEIGANMQF